MITKSVYPSDDDIDVDLVIKKEENGGTPRSNKLTKMVYRKFFKYHQEKIFKRFFLAFASSSTLDSIRTSNSNLEPSEFEIQQNNFDKTHPKIYFQEEGDLSNIYKNLDENQQTLKREDANISIPPIVPPRHLNTVVQSNISNTNGIFITPPVPVTRSSLTKSMIFNYF